MIDSAGPVREGEALDLAALERYLQAELGPGGELAVEQFPGGHSNLTYLVRWGGREYVLRRPPFGSRVKSAHDMGREVRILSKLGPAWDKAPTPIRYCDDEAVLGAPFYVMERVRGVILRKTPPAGLRLDEEAARALSAALVDTLVELHALDYAGIGLGDLGKPDGYVRRQVEGWTRRYADAQTDDIPAVGEVAAWLAEHMPASGAPALLHNDFKFDNVVLDPGELTRVVGVLDWEMSTVGDPLMDLGTALCYWVEAGDPADLRATAFGPTARPGMMTRQELAERYAERRGRAVEHLVFYYAFGLFKLAVVAQQIYYRFHHGHTSDARFAAFLPAVRILSRQAASAIERDTVAPA